MVGCIGGRPHSVGIAGRDGGQRIAPTPGASAGRRRGIPAGSSVTVAGTEVSFGIPARPACLNRPGGQPVVFRCRIDRVDRSADGSRVAVTDYKTGKAATRRRSGNDVVAGARRCSWRSTARQPVPTTQMPRSLRAIGMSPTAKAATSGASSRSTTQLGPACARSSLPCPTASSKACFLVVPGEDDGQVSFQNCRRCAFDAVCPADRDEVFARKHGDPVMAGWHQLGASES